MHCQGQVHYHITLDWRAADPDLHVVQENLERLQSDLWYQDTLCGVWGPYQWCYSDYIVPPALYQLSSFLTLLIQTLITSCWDYCNCLFDLPLKSLHERSSSYHHQNSLYSLVAYQSQYRVQDSTFSPFNVLHYLSPSYLSKLFHIFTPSCTLRSSTAIQLSTPSGQEPPVGPIDICNSDSIATFKSRLKAYIANSVSYSLWNRSLFCTKYSFSLVCLFYHVWWIVVCV